MYANVVIKEALRILKAQEPNILVIRDDEDYESVLLFYRIEKPEREALKQMRELGVVYYPKHKAFGISEDWLNDLSEAPREWLDLDKKITFRQDIEKAARERLPDYSRFEYKEQVVRIEVLHQVTELRPTQTLQDGFVEFKKFIVRFAYSDTGFILLDIKESVV
jgi:hypothetical protein